MANSNELIAQIRDLLNTKLEVREGKKIPASEDLSLKGDGVNIDATFLYADLAGSSQLASKCPRDTTAKIISAYLNICTKIIRKYSGEIRSFDGDRVMGVFYGPSKEKDAVRCALEINGMVYKELNPTVQEKFDSIKKNNITITHCIGIDTGEALAVRSGIRSNNDLIWIGQAPSFAAKLSDIRNLRSKIFISSSCYDKLGEDEKNCEGENMWTFYNKHIFSGKEFNIYGTNYITPP